MRHILTPPLPAASLAQVSTHVLAAISLSVARGEILTLLGAGPEPAAVLALMAGFVRPDSGEVCVNGRALNRTPPHRREIGMVARPLALFPHLDVLGHAGFGAEVSAETAKAMLHRLGLADHATQRPRGLSAALRLRVALARALAPGPELLLLQDPLAELPQSSRPHIQALLRGWAVEHRLAMLHATDDVAAALGLSDRIGVMADGRLLQIGTPRALYDAPDSLAVAEMLGPINVLRGRKLGREDDIARIRLEGGQVVEARDREELAEGDACVVAIRPERIAAAAADLGEGALAGRLVETLFEGDRTRMRFALDGAMLTVLRPSALPAPRGDQVSLAWQPHHAQVFRA
jgi:ABC-type Fe3+/spermidine/putrescine transport system ATPase subunit